MYSSSFPLVSSFFLLCILLSFNTFLRYSYFRYIFLSISPLIVYLFPHFVSVSIFKITISSLTLYLFLSFSLKIFCFLQRFLLFLLPFFLQVFLVCLLDQCHFISFLLTYFPYFTLFFHSLIIIFLYPFILLFLYFSWIQVLPSFLLIL